MSWQCSLCDFGNPYSTSKCEMCDTPRVVGGGQQSQIQQPQQQIVPNNNSYNDVNATIILIHIFLSYNIHIFLILSS